MNSLSSSWLGAEQSRRSARVGWWLVGWLVGYLPILVGKAPVLQNCQSRNSFSHQGSALYSHMYVVTSHFSY